VAEKRGERERKEECEIKERGREREEYGRG